MKRWEDLRCKNDTKMGNISLWNLAWRMHDTLRDMGSGGWCVNCWERREIANKLVLVFNWNKIESFLVSFGRVLKTIILQIVISPWHLSNWRYIRSLHRGVGELQRAFHQYKGEENVPKMEWKDLSCTSSTSFQNECAGEKTSWRDQKSSVRWIYSAK